MIVHLLTMTLSIISIWSLVLIQVCLLVKLLLSLLVHQSDLTLRYLEDTLLVWTCASLHIVSTCGNTSIVIRLGQIYRGLLRWSIPSISSLWLWSLFAYLADDNSHSMIGTKSFHIILIIIGEYSNVIINIWWIQLLISVKRVILCETSVL